MVPKLEVPKKWILHADLDAFYASVEQRLDPSLLGKPVIVGPDPKKGATRGVVLTASYEARKYGIRSAMPIMHAYRLLPDGIYRFTGFKEYKLASKHVMNIFSQFCPNVIQTSIDEAYLDISDTIDDYNDIDKIYDYCKSIIDTIWDKEQLPISIGASHTRTIAKIASGMKKPKGITIIPAAKFREILDPLKLKEISGIGKKSFESLKQQGYETIGDVCRLSRNKLPPFLRDIWLRMHGFSTGNQEKSHGRSHSRERTLSKDEYDHLTLRNILRQLTMTLLNDLKENSFRTFSIKVRFSDFKTATRSRSFSSYMLPKDDKTQRLLIQTANELFNEFIGKGSFRLLGVKASNFSEKELAQKSLFDFI